MSNVQQDEKRVIDYNRKYKVDEEAVRLSMGLLQEKYPNLLEDGYMYLLELKSLRVPAIVIFEALDDALYCLDNREHKSVLSRVGNNYRYKSLHMLFEEILLERWSYGRFGKDLNSISSLVRFILNGRLTPELISKLDMINGEFKDIPYGDWKKLRRELMILVY